MRQKRLLLVSTSALPAHRLTGSFVGANTFVGTYSVSFSGSDCGCFGGLGTPCVNQTWNISAGR